jgi:hypothetical protein
MTKVRKAVSMKTVQLTIHDSDHAGAVRKLLLRDGTHDVYLVDQPNLQLDGVVVMDEHTFQNLPDDDSNRERFVIVTSKGSDRLARMFDAGIRHVVFEGDSPYTTQLAIIAAELRLPSESGPPTQAGSFPPRYGKCGPRNADTGF